MSNERLDVGRITHTECEVSVAPYKNIRPILIGIIECEWKRLQFKIVVGQRKRSVARWIQPNIA